MANGAVRILSVLITLTGKRMRRSLVAKPVDANFDARNGKVGVALVAANVSSLPIQKRLKSLVLIAERH